MLTALSLWKVAVNDVQGSAIELVLPMNQTSLGVFRIVGKAGTCCECSSFTEQRNAVVTLLAAKVDVVPHRLDRLAGKLCITDLGLLQPYDIGGILVYQRLQLV